ncbi:MAG: hypothetical protein L6W00_09835 [Lentisphaeria bacterium]|nr:MAG: hypothetical protein L6W00_30420 [Lentisphaeria bacterium]UKI33695.1 MAG: hypothetical protein L6W00_09835 [Lentisphaeria bacterium]
MAEARVAIRDLAEEVEKLSNELAWFRRQLFGSKTEHYIPRDDTPSLFPEEMSPESPKEVPTATVAEHERKVRQANALSEIPADLPREERVIDVPEEERLGMILIGYDESERIAYRTGLYVIHFKRAKYADPSDTLRGVVTAPAPGMCLIQSAAEPVMTPLSLPKLLRIKWRMPSPWNVRRGCSATRDFRWLRLRWKISTNVRQTLCSPFMSGWSTGLCNAISSMRTKHSSN